MEELVLRPSSKKRAQPRPYLVLVFAPEKIQKFNEKPKTI
jgi:hypothetical protein